MLKYIVYLDPVGLPRVTTVEFADQINEDSIIRWAHSIEGAIVGVVQWHDEQAQATVDMTNDEFKALMGLSDVNE